MRYRLTSPSPRRGPAAALLVALALLTAPTVLTAQDAPPPATDLTGAWVLTVESPNGTGTRDVTFVQEGGKLTGTIASSMAVGEIEGTIEGNLVRFVALVAMDTGNFQVVYEATFEDGQLKRGSVDFGDYGAGTFTGVRKVSGA